MLPQCEGRLGLVDEAKRRTVLLAGHSHGLWLRGLLWQLALGITKTDLYHLGLGTSGWIPLPAANDTAGFI